MPRDHSPAHATHTESGKAVMSIVRRERAQGARPDVHPAHLAGERRRRHAERAIEPRALVGGGRDARQQSGRGPRNPTTDEGALDTRQWLELAVDVREIVQRTRRQAQAFGRVVREPRKPEAPPAPTQSTRLRAAVRLARTLSSPTPTGTMAMVMKAPSGAA